MVLGIAVLVGGRCRAQDLPVEELKLPPLRIQGKAAKAHTQGLEIADGKCYVTARREDARPKRALLLRAGPSAEDWTVWDITPLDAKANPTALDHPGGLQSDGTRLWIPLAESKRNGRSLIRAFSLKEMEAGRPLKWGVEIPVEDHIGAVAVLTKRQLLFGANWDTEKVYAWDFTGRLQRTLTGPDMEARGLGPITGAGGRAGVAVQDWKCAGDRLFASGLFRATGSAAVSSQSRLVWFEEFLEPGVRRWTVTLPTRRGTELSREAMAISGDFAFFLPEDLGATNRMFRVPLAELLKRGVAQQTRDSRNP